MDEGYDFILNFENEEWSEKTLPPESERYTCLKADDYTYLASYELGGVRLRVNHAFVIYIENLFVTCIISNIGKNKR